MTSIRRAEDIGVWQPLAQSLARSLAWLIAVLLLLNTLWFVLRASSPIIRDDSWYFLEVFLRKAIAGHLELADFFVRRMGADHSQPLFKLILLIEWRYFDLDFTFGAVVGVFAAAASGLVFYKVIAAERRDERSDALRYLAWVGICAVLFTLNAYAGIWTWPLVALENVTNLIVLFFFLAVWRAHRTQRHVLLVFTTLFLFISSDDSALIAGIAAAVALLLVRLRDSAKPSRSIWRILALIVACAIVVRVGYLYVPIVGGRLTDPISSNVGALLGRFREGGWWMWIALPLSLPVLYRSPIPSIQDGLWQAVHVAMALPLVVAHLWFWRAAFRSEHNRASFVAVCLMLVSYGWVAGIILGRISISGNDYLYQPRYVLLYGGHLIALLLMWAGSSDAPSTARWRAIGGWLSAAACVLLIAGQIPVSLQEWRQRPLLKAYNITMAHQIDNLARDPASTQVCVPELPICRWPIEKRRELTRLLSENRLNVFSPMMQRRHAYLPKLVPASTRQ